MPDSNNSKVGWQALRKSCREETPVEVDDVAQAYHSTFTGATGSVVLADLARKFRTSEVYDFDSPNCNEQAAYIMGQNKVIETIAELMVRHETGE